jgi:hypothetical protein
MNQKPIILCLSLLVAGTACQRAVLPTAQHQTTTAVAAGEAQAAQTAGAAEETTGVARAVVTETTVPELLANAGEDPAGVVVASTAQDRVRAATTRQTPTATSPAKAAQLTPKEVQKLMKAASRPQQGKAFKGGRRAQALTGLQTAGIIVGSVGFLVALFVSLLLGLLLLIGGVLMLLLGKNAGGGGRSRPDDNRGGDLQDVVYLKNGSIVRGTIVEQVPNQSLKIQTRDGSVFVYEMAEVTKITKE